MRAVWWWERLSSHGIHHFRNHSTNVCICMHVHSWFEQVVCNIPVCGWGITENPTAASIAVNPFLSWMLSHRLIYISNTHTHRDRHRQTDTDGRYVHTDTHRHTQTHTETDTDRQTHTDGRYVHRDTHTHTHTHIHTRIDIQKSTHISRTVVLARTPFCIVNTVCSKVLERLSRIFSAHDSASCGTTATMITWEWVSDDQCSNRRSEAYSFTCT
jgi:hypothetical protein